MKLFWKIILGLLFITCLILLPLGTPLNIIVNLRSSQSTNNINYEFEKNTPYNASQYANQTLRNMRLTPQYTPYYNATYDFNNETLGTSGTNIGWIDTEVGTDSNYSVVVVALEDGHLNVIQFNASGDNGAYADWDTEELTSIESGTIELWFKYIDNGVGYIRLRVYGAVSTFTYMYIRSDANDLIIYYGDGGGGSTSSAVGIDADTWHHIRIAFDCATDTFSMWLNGILEIDDENFWNDSNDTSFRLINYRLYNGAGSNALQGFVDAIGYSWDTDYNIWDNYYPSQVFNSSSYRPERFEFDIGEDGEPYQDNQQETLIGWNKLEIEA